MTIIPERLLQNTLVEGLRTFRRNPKLLAALFQTLTEPEFERIVKLITTKAIPVKINYPRQEFSAPSLVLLLKSESEAETFLGDFMGYGNPPNELVYDTVEGHAGSQSKMQGLNQKVFSSVISGATSTSVIFDEDSGFNEFYLSNDSKGDFELIIVNGTGKGQKRNILNINSDSVDIEGTFTVPLDNTSVVNIRKLNTTLSIGEPVRIFNEDALLYRQGANFQVNYDLDIVSGSPEEVIYLSYIVKAIFFLQKAALEDQGLLSLTLAASDFVPRRDFIPDNLFVRQLNIKFHYSFSVLAEQQVFSQLQLALCDGYEIGTIDLED